MTVMSFADSLDFADAADAPIPYIERTRSWYLALGYGNPYRWAHYREVPFTPMKVALRHATIGLVTTAVPFDPAKGPQGPGAPYNAAAKFYEVYAASTAGEPDLRIAHVAIDRKHTSMEDRACWFPLKAVRKLVDAGVVGRISPRFYGVPTDRSQRAILANAEAVVSLCLQDRLDAAVLIPNCPVCHQALAMTARALERAGIPTVIMGCAKDVVEFCGVPRFLFSDFPLGNGAGRPHDAASQTFAVNLALDVLVHAPGPRTTVQNPLAWSADPAWKADYCNARQYTAEQLAALRVQNDDIKATAHRVRGRTVS